MKKIYKKIWCISDTHAQHGTLKIPEGIDIIIYGGDSTNYRDLFYNQPEFEDFIQWFSNLPIKSKVLIAGNHDAWATKKYNIDRVKDLGIHYLEHEYTQIGDLLIFGSPYTPTFCDWHFMKGRDKLSRYWEALTESIDILVTHGPCKGILDLSHDKNNKLEYCGDNSLTKAVFKNQPKYHIFGHIHDSEGCFNSGVTKLSNINTTFMNVSCVMDGRFDKGCVSNGQIIEV